MEPVSIAVAPVILKTTNLVFPNYPEVESAAILYGSFFHNVR